MPMSVYRHPSARQKADRLDVIRYKFECVEACSRGTDDPREFEQHLAKCKHIWPEVRTQAARRLKRGERFVLDAPPRIKDREGQMPLPLAPTP
jgi:predicted kinase